MFPPAYRFDFARLRLAARPSGLRFAHRVYRSLQDSKRGSVGTLRSITASMLLAISPTLASDTTVKTEACAGSELGATVQRCYYRTDKSSRTGALR